MDFILQSLFGDYLWLKGEIPSFRVGSNPSKSASIKCKLCVGGSPLKASFAPKVNW